MIKKIAFLYYFEVDCDLYFTIYTGAFMCFSGQDHIPYSYTFSPSLRFGGEIVAPLLPSPPATFPLPHMFYIIDTMPR